MNQTSLTNSLLAECNDIEVVVFAHCLREVELTLDFFGSHHFVIVFMPDSLLVLHQVVAFVLLGVGADITGILSLDPREVQDFFLFLFGLRVATDFTPSQHLVVILW